MTELERAKELGQAALATLEANRRRIDDLNVYPVPDGDTGTNLTLTARAIMEVLEASTAADRATLAKELTRAALMGARGNSGVIFSQILRGAAEALGEAGLLDAATIRRAFRAASDAAYRAVRRPVEGTMLSVIRELAEEAEDPRNAALEPAALLKKLIERGEDALARTPDQLDVLREAGVVDAGGAGLLEIVRGVSAALSGEPLPTRRPRTPTRPGSTRSTRSSREFRYCTVFVIEGEELDAEALETRARAARRLAARRRRRDRAQGARPHRRARRGARARDGARDDRGRRDREHAQADRASAGADPRGRPRPGADARDRRRRGRARAREPPSLRELRRHAGDRGRPDDEPVDRRHRRRDRGDARDRGARAPEQLERDPLRRAGGEARRQAGPRDPVALGSGRARARSSATCRRSSAEENEAAMLEALEQVATGEVTVASRDVELDGVDVRKGAWLGLADGAAVASSADFDEVALRGRRAPARRRPRGADAAHRRGRARSRRPAARGSRSGTRTSSSTCSRAASRTIRCSSRPSRLKVGRGGRPQPIRVLLVEDNDVFRQALDLLLELQDGIEVVGAVAEGYGGRRRLPRASTRTSS